jgi:hypothetical protein
MTVVGFPRVGVVVLGRHGYDPRAGSYGAGLRREVANRSSNVTRRLAEDCQLALRPLGLCRGDRSVGGYPRDGFLGFFHGPSHIGHQSF